MALSQRELDIQHMLTCQVHIGTHNLEHKMKDYVWRRRSDGVHIINVAKTWEKLHLAARIIVAIENQRTLLRFLHVHLVNVLSSSTHSTQVVCPLQGATLQVHLPITLPKISVNHVF